MPEIGAGVRSTDGRLRVVVLVSQDASDLYFANKLIRAVNVVGIVVEQQRLPVDTSSRAAKALKLLRQPHVLLTKLFAVARNSLRRRLSPSASKRHAANFGEFGERIINTTDVPCVRTRGVNAINEDEYVEWVRALKPDVLAVCGTTLIREDLLALPKVAALNLHGGLSQRYRGLFTTDWALHNAEPEYVGATVHLIASGVDDGDVVYQARPDLDAADHPNSAYEKVVKLGVKMMIRAIEDFERGVASHAPLDSPGAVYRRTDFTHAVKRRAWKKCRQGVICDYLASKKLRDAAVLSHMINPFPIDAGIDSQ